MSCLTCSSFDPYSRGGWCDYHKCETSPSSSCRNEDNNGSKYSTSKQCCSTCESYSGDYCDYRHCRVSPTDVCGSWS